MAEYIPLQKLYYKNNSSQRDADIKKEALRRRNEESSFRTGIRIESGELFLAVPQELTILSEKLLRVERKVSQLWHDLPGIAQWAYLRNLIMDEIVSTNKIEGVYSTRRQIQEALERTETKASSNEYKRFREFAYLYMELTNKEHIYPQTPADIRAIYDSVVAGEFEETEKPDGQFFRKEAVDVISSSQEVIHSGVASESAIISMLEQMLGILESPLIPGTFSAIISHFLFEYIHPFYDGNGRTGRYLLALYLSEPLSLATVLSLSSVIAENKAKYYKAFKDAEAPLNHAELTFFVIQIMEFIRTAQDEVMENLERKKFLLQKAEKALPAFIEEPYYLSQKEMNVIFQAVQYELFDAFSEVSLKDIAANSGVSLQTARKYTLELEEKGLLKTVSLKPLKFKLTQEAVTMLNITAL